MTVTVVTLKIVTLTLKSLPLGSMPSNQPENNPHSSIKVICIKSCTTYFKFSMELRAGYLVLEWWSKNRQITKCKWKDNFLMGFCQIFTNEKIFHIYVTSVTTPSNIHSPEKVGSLPAIGWFPLFITSTSFHVTSPFRQYLFHVIDWSCSQLTVRSCCGFLLWGINCVTWLLRRLILGVRHQGLRMGDLRVLLHESLTMEILCAFDILVSIVIKASTNT